MNGNKMYAMDTIRIVDNFIRDPELLQAINDFEYWHQNSQPSVWYERYTDPRNPLEEYVNRVYHEMFPTIISPKITGFEYWGWNVDAGDRGIPIHVDNDEYKQWVEGISITPHYITVFYPEVTDDVEGGELLLYNDHGYMDTDFWTDPTPLTERDKTPLGKPTIIQPKKNRLIIAPGCYFHEVTPLTRGFRRSLNCNPWERPDDGREGITFDYDKY